MTKQAPTQSLMPPGLALALQFLAGLAGAAAVFAGVGSYVGAQYLKAYYTELGIPISELQLSTQDYLLRAETVVIFLVVGTAVVSLGLLVKYPLGTYIRWLDSAYGLCLRWLNFVVPYTLSLVQRLPTPLRKDASARDIVVHTWRLLRTSPFSAAMGPDLGALQRAVVYMLIILLLVAFPLLVLCVMLVPILLGAGVLAVIFGGLWFLVSARYEAYETWAIMVLGVGTFVTSLLISWIIQRQRQKQSGDETFWGRITPGIPFALALAVTIVVAPPLLGAGEAYNDLSHNNFKLATFLTTGHVSMPGDCNSTPVIDESQARSLCQHTDVRVITLNNDRYFVFLKSEPDTIHIVSKDSVVSITYDLE